ncbi:MAG: hypothetical protein LBT56_06790 [Prevotellaceae bacterium]|nr:hypothetical protein [Prevotellaceae bacterium]
MKKQKSNSYKKPQAQQKPIQKAVVEKPFSWIKFAFKILLLLAVVASVVIYTDEKGYFTADQRDNHIRRKWKSFYKFTEEKQVDIVLLGNSHVITGIDPFVLSIATGTNCFILGQSGTGIDDAYFHLEEALRYTTPKMVILETYCISNATLKTKDIVPVIQSFEAHRNSLDKLWQTTRLLPSDAWVSVYSPTIRNHSFLLTDTARISYNIKNPVIPEQKKLDLGRFTRFGTGLSDSVIALYDSLGAPINGEKYLISAYSQKYLRKIMKLCEEKNISVLFLTIPMYYKHISNYETWKTALGKELEKYPQTKWLNFQQPYDSVRYNKNAFENTYSDNQHLTNLGMALSAYKLSEFLYNNYADILPNRKQEKAWINDFYSQDHFVFNHDVVEEMKDYVSIEKNRNAGKFHIKELVLQEMKDANRIILKIDKNPELTSKITLQLKIEFKDKILITPIQMQEVQDVFPPQHKVYIAGLRKEVKVLGLP